jgi:hypothetical protein
LASLLSSARAAALINAVTRNGSFESSASSPSPWSYGGGSMPFTSEIVTDAAGAAAADGFRYALLRGPWRPGVEQTVAYDPLLGRDFVLAWDVKVDAADAAAGNGFTQTWFGDPVIYGAAGRKRGHPERRSLRL